MPNPFEDDQLERKASADYLTLYLTGRHATRKERKSKNSFTLNINAPWGTGKTYFLENWAAQMKERGFTTIYFNAWEHDYSQQPIIGFISEIEDQLKNITNAHLLQPKINAVYEYGKGLISTGVFEGINAVVKTKVGIDLQQIHNRVSERTSTSVKDIQQKLYDEHSRQKNTIERFRIALLDFVNSLEATGAHIPLFLFVDELDRCRPTYAIELLETVKHIFGVEGVYVILATDTEQLSASIKAVYGNDFDASRYLRRFFDLEYTFPLDDNYKMAVQLLDQHGLLNNDRLLTPIFIERDKHRRAEIFSFVSTSFELGPRDQQQLADLIEATVNTTEGRIVFPCLLFAAAVTFHPNSKRIFSELIQKGATDSTPFDFKTNPATYEYRPRHDRSVTMKFNDIIPPVLSMLQDDIQQLQKHAYRDLTTPVTQIASAAIEPGVLPIGSYIDLIRRASSLTKGIRAFDQHER